ncbi:hypothetical protein [Streptomyces sp. NPDC006274]|uniref:hypothetical protein n=1 Tax=unclassified Streptomyces TaxID=2593676 RepID=UPI0033BD99E6
MTAEPGIESVVVGGGGRQPCQRRFGRLVLTFVRRVPRPGADRTKPAVPADMRRDLRPAVFEDHMAAVGPNLARAPERSCDTAEICTWQQPHRDEELPILPSAGRPPAGHTRTLTRRRRPGEI